MSITVIWFIAITIFAFVRGIAVPTSLNELGDFLAGAFAPVAFLWLILGYVQQGKQLEQNTKALEQQESALQLQIEEMRESVGQQKIMTDIQFKQQKMYLKSLLPSFIAEVNLFEKKKSDDKEYYEWVIGWKNVGAEISDFLVISHTTEADIFREDILKRGETSHSVNFDTNEDVELVEYEKEVCMEFRVFYLDQAKNHHSELYSMRIHKESIEDDQPFILGVQLIDENYSCSKS